jgi:catechol 2,3-dioxygenase-like lactoylglutathione lyase family enzyme
MFLGLRTIIYPAPDLAELKRWWSELLGVEPYFDQPFYVGFRVGGYELGLDPNAELELGPITYWGVADVSVALDRLLAAGASAHGDGVNDVGDHIRVATVRDPAGSVVGVIENPHFRLPADPPVVDGPGR